MASLKELKNRIASVKATQKITKAMQMVAAAKLRRAQESAEAARPFAERMESVLGNIASSVSDISAAPKLLGLSRSGLFTLLFWMGSFTALLTAFYTFRAFFMTFHGPEKIPDEAGHHAHESPLPMTSPLMRSDCKAVTNAIVALVNSEMCLTPRYSASSASS